MHGPQRGAAGPEWRCSSFWRHCRGSARHTHAAALSALHSHRHIHAAAPTPRRPHRGAHTASLQVRSLINYGSVLRGERKLASARAALSAAVAAAAALPALHLLREKSKYEWAGLLAACGEEVRSRGGRTG